MGTLSLILGIIFIALGVGAIPFELSSYSFVNGIIQAIILISIGVAFIREYDKDKEKSKNS